MCELQWDPLAVLYLTRSDCPEEIYCLCSRVFVRNKDERLKINAIVGDEFSASETELLNEDIADFHSEHLEVDHSQLTHSDAKHDGDTEVVSCYCSASHTDNISTDEHDSLRDSHSARPAFHKTLQSSDSGADLTEHNNPFNNDKDAAWHKFWANHGERLIWDSWIAKYSDYINPEYLNSCDLESNDSKIVNDNKETPTEVVSKAEHSKLTKFSFEKKDLEKIEPNLSIIDENKELTDPTEHKIQDVAFKNRVLVRNLSGSDSYEKLNTDNSEGWNPLSPLSIDCETEAERLLSSRCGSYASGSVRTVDSMTNVTRMTVSSIDLSESSKNSDSFSSFSSVQSSLSSNSSDDCEESADVENQWNVLWKKHYEVECLEQYKKFKSRHSDLNDSDIKKEDNFINIQKNVLQSLKILSVERRHSNNSSIEENEISHKKVSKQKRISKKSIESVGYILNTLKMDEIDIPRNNMEEICTSFVKHKKEDVTPEENILKAMGLPVAFGHNKNNNKKIQASKSFESEVNDQSSTNRIKAAFNLMGIELNEGDDVKFQGHVDYKMKHIRLQNRHLKLLNNPNKDYKPKHLFFDDDGNEIQEDRESDEIMLQNSLSDGNSENKQSSSSNEEDIELAKTSPFQFKEDKDKEDIPMQEIEEKDETLSGSRKRKRKRKLALPPEIKENPKLRKYWQRRFNLFHKFDMGIKLDDESWYSVTPEQVAKNTAQRCQCDVIVDAFCGAGGNSIQFALTCEKVIAIDIDPKKIELARNNADVYGVADRIEFIVGDFFQLADSLKADVIFLSPPWGGPAYQKLPSYDLEELLQPAPLTELIKSARKISQDIALFLPKNSNTHALLKAAGPGGYVEIEQNFINKKLIAITAYYNDLIKQI